MTIQEFIDQPGNKIVYLGDPVRCPPCRRYKMDSDKVKQELPDVAFLEIHPSDSPELVQEAFRLLPVSRSIPQFFLFKGSDLVWSTVGFPGYLAFAAEVKKNL